MTKEIKTRLEYLRGEILAERISFDELAELESLAEYIEAGDVVLLEAAGVPESNERILSNYDDVPHMCSFGSCKNKAFKFEVCQKHYEQGLG